MERWPPDVHLATCDHRPDDEADHGQGRHQQRAQRDSRHAEQIQRRLHFALGRLAPAIHSVDLVVVDINGPRGGNDKHCRLRVRGSALREIVIEHVGADVMSTVSLAAERAKRAVVRSLARRRWASPAVAF